MAHPDPHNVESKERKNDPPDTTNPYQGSITAKPLEEDERKEEDNKAEEPAQNRADKEEK